MCNFSGLRMSSFEVIEGGGGGGGARPPLSQEVKKKPDLNGVNIPLL